MAVPGAAKELWTGSFRQCVEKRAVCLRHHPKVVPRLGDISPVPHAAVILDFSGNGRLHSALAPRSVDPTIADLPLEVLR